jgi:hypothetical protein
MDFMAFCRNRDRIVGVDSTGRPFFYDIASRCISTNLPSMPYGVAKHMSLPVGDNGLFVMSDIEPQFVALMDGCNPNMPHGVTKPNWYWQSLVGTGPPVPARRGL